MFACRGQVNTYIEKIAAVRSTRAVRDDLFLPLFWYEEFGEIDDALEKEIKMKSIYPLRIAHHAMLFSLVVGSFFTMLSCVFCLCCRKRKKRVHMKTQVTYAENEATNYEKLTNLDDAESTKTDSSGSNQGSSKTVSIISSGSHDSIESNASFILVQPVQHAEPLPPDSHQQTHSLAQLQLIPAFGHFNPFYPKRAAGTEAAGETNGTQFKSQIENNNLIPAVTYRPPSPRTLDESVKMISRLIELNSRNLVETDMAINHQQNSQQKDRSTNEFTMNQRRTKLTPQHSHDSFD